MSRAFNFSAGPATLPFEVLEEAQRDFVDYQGTGMSLFESSHRGKAYSEVHAEAQANLRELLGLSDDYAVLFLQGGASTQFAMIPMNLLGSGQTAYYANTGAWSGKAIKEAKLLGDVKVVGETAGAATPYMPSMEQLAVPADAAYLHITSNETIEGSQFKQFPACAAPLVCDMSSDILSRPFDPNAFGLIYAGLQKNLGPAGGALVVIRKDLAERAPAGLSTMFKYSTHISKDSLFNTPPCFAIYMLCLVTRWLKQHGMDAIYANNVAKAGQLYSAIDTSDFYRGVADDNFRSDMNVTFRIVDHALEAAFVTEAAALGLSGLKGHRDVGGLRASIYNAFPNEGIKALIDFMGEFERTHG
jgi:phosphoserine aminotransferase